MGGKENQMLNNLNFAKYATMSVEFRFIKYFCIFEYYVAMSY